MNACKHPLYKQRYQHTKRRLGRQRGPKVAQIELSRKLTEAIWHTPSSAGTWLNRTCIAGRAAPNPNNPLTTRPHS